MIYTAIGLIGLLLLDLPHPFNDIGQVTPIWVCAKVGDFPMAILTGKMMGRKWKGVDQPTFGRVVYVIIEGMGSNPTLTPLNPIKSPTLCNVVTG